MAKKITPPATMRAGDPEKSDASRARRPAVIAVLAVLVVAIGIGAWTFSQKVARERVVRALPPAPDLTAKPAELRRRVMVARDGVASGEKTLEHVAELARLYHVNGFPAEAEACWSWLHAKEPKNARWSYYLADLRLAAFDETRARAFMEETVRLAANYAPASLKLAEMDFKSSRLDEAERNYRQVLELDPKDPYAAFGLARVDLERGRSDDGKRRIEELNRTTPDFSPAHNVYAEVLAREGKSAEAAQARWRGTTAGRFRAAADPWLEELRGWCYDAMQLLVWGAAELQTNRRAEAEALFQRAIELAPDDPRCYLSLGKLHLETGRPEKARDWFERGSRLPDPPEEMFVDLSHAGLALDQAAEALRAAERGLARAPNSADLLNVRGLALVAAGRFEEALVAYHAAITREEKGAILTNLSLVLITLGRKEEARAALLRALERQPMYPKAVNVLARLELEAGNLETAERYIRPFYEQYPGSSNARDLMGKWCLQAAMRAASARDATAAERVAREGLAANPAMTELYGFLSMLYAQHGRVDEAIEALETARKSNPNDPRVAFSLAGLLTKIGRIRQARELLAECQQAAQRRGENELAQRYNQMLRSLPD